MNTSAQVLTDMGPQPFYNGQRVSSVRIIANPHLNPESFASLVQQKSGEPYSNAKVNGSLEALKASGKFTDVQAYVVPELKGLGLTFVLEPAYYIGVLEFPEAAKHFPYSRLLQTVNFPDQTPFDKTELPSAERRLEKFFNQDGYFQAQVQSQTEYDDGNQLANLTFPVDLKKQARIGNIQIEGVSQQEQQDLLHSVQSWWARLSGSFLKPGKSYTANRLKDATTAMQHKLQKQKYLASKLKRKPPVYHPDTNRADVSYTTELGPRVNIDLTGAKLTWVPFMEGIDEKKEIPIYSAGAINRELVDEGQHNLFDYFQKKGYFNVKVATTFNKEPDTATVIYTIQKGRKHKVEEIVFDGNQALSSGMLAANIPIKQHTLISHGTYSPQLLSTSVKNIKDLYHNAGFEDVKVTPQVASQPKQISVTFQITEGPRTIVNDLHVTGNRSVALDELAPKGLELRPGAPFSPVHLSNDRNRITASYLDRGFVNAEIKAEVTRQPGDPHRVNITYDIDEQHQVQVSHVIYLGQQHTRKRPLVETTDLSVEAPLSEAALLKAQSQLYDIGIFDWASVGPRKPIEQQRQEETLVKVHEAKRNDITYGFGFEVEHRGGNIPAGTVAVPGLPSVSLGNKQVAPSEATYIGPRGSIAWTRRNMRGLGETAALSLLASRLDQRVLATYSDPHFRYTNWNSLTSLSVERTTENPLFAASLGDAAFQLERVLNYKTNSRLQLRYDFNKTDLSHLLVPELVLPQDRSVRLSTFSGTYLKDTRDHPLDAHHGQFQTYTLSITPTALGSSANFARFYGQYAFYKPVHGMVWANSLRLGLAKPFLGSFVPTSQLFFSGGGTTLRGFPIDEAGPQRIVPFCNVLSGVSGCTNITVPVGGRQLFILNSELRFPLKIMKPLGGVVFYDGGNVYSAINFNNFVNNYTNTIGFGLRYATPVGPIRIDIGRNLSPVPGLNPTQYFITLGQAF